MRYFWVLLMVFAMTAPAYARRAAVEAEPLDPVMTGEKAPEADKKAPLPEDAEPITPEQQALLICQTADMMAEKIKGPEFTPGVDAYGRPVAPADVYNAMPFEVPEQVEVPIAMDVMATLGINSPPVEGKARMGTLTVFKGGKLLYNGQDITNSVEGYCRAHMKKMDEKKDKDQ